MALVLPRAFDKFLYRLYPITAGLIDRKVTQQRPLHVEYLLTKKGKSLDLILALLAEFSFQYEPEKILKDKKPRHMKQYFGTEILSEIYD